jgi:hypothetical protein
LNKILQVKEMILNFKPQKYKAYYEKIRDVSHFILSLCLL